MDAAEITSQISSKFPLRVRDILSFVGTTELAAKK